MSLTVTALWMAATFSAGLTIGLHRGAQRTRHLAQTANNALEHVAKQLNGYIAAQRIRTAFDAYERGDHAIATGILLGPDHPLLDQPITDELDQQLTDAINNQLDQLAATIRDAPSARSKPKPQGDQP